MQEPQGRPRLLLVDDDPNVLDFYLAALERGGYDLVTASDGSEADTRLAGGGFDLVVSDLDMPKLSGLDLLRAVRARDLDLPVILATGNADVKSAIEAMEHGALRYLTKPVDAAHLRQVVEYGVRIFRMARMQREARSLVAGDVGIAADRAGLEVRFDRALETLWMAYQPIVSWSRRTLVAYEALVRSDEPSLARPRELVLAAEQLGRVHDFGRRTRAKVAATIDHLPRTAGVQVNLHAKDLEDEDLFLLSAPLSRHARRVVLEINDRTKLGSVADARERTRQLKALGYRIAIDDLGAGDGGLAAFAQLEPDMVKLDMTLVRDVDRSPTKERLIRSMAGLCRDLNIVVVTEGVETPAERDTVVAAGCDLLQGYLFGSPVREAVDPVFA
jgi:EAL domain-containing protein (putative c-di-GMP-specific phosphodiesterase class I)